MRGKDLSGEGERSAMRMKMNRDEIKLRTILNRGRCDKEVKKVRILRGGKGVISGEPCAHILRCLD